MKREDLQEILHLLEFDVENDPTLIYVFYETPDGVVHNFSVSVQHGHRMSDRRLEALMKREYPATRQGRVMCVERTDRQTFVEWMETMEVCRMLHVSEKTLRRWTHRGMFHPSQIGRRLYYSREEVETVLKSNAILDNGRLDYTEAQLARDADKRGS